MAYGKELTYCSSNLCFQDIGNGIQGKIEQFDMESPIEAECVMIEVSSSDDEPALLRSIVVNPVTKYYCMITCSRTGTIYKCHIVFF